MYMNILYIYNKKSCAFKISGIWIKNYIAHSHVIAKKTKSLHIKLET